MKKVIILVLIAVAAYGAYKSYGSMTSGPGAFDEQGRPKVLLFTMDGCGEPCTEVLADLRQRGVAFEEINASTDEGRKRFEPFGVGQLPLTVVGTRTVIGSDLPAIESALAEGRGVEALSPAVVNVMRNHFDQEGKPKVVLYGTTTCGYCNRMRQHLESKKIAYQFMDVGFSSDARRDFDTLRGRGYPLIFVGYRRIDGCDEARVDQAVKDLL